VTPLKGKETKTTLTVCWTTLNKVKRNNINKLRNNTNKRRDSRKKPEEAEEYSY
jgi:hypothetical protein